MFLFCRVEDRNDPMMQKMRRYVKVFSNIDEKEGLEKSDPMKETPKLRPKNRGNHFKKAQAGWEMIRHSALCLEMEQEEPGEIQDIRYIWNETWSDYYLNFSGASTRHWLVDSSVLCFSL